MKYKSILDNFKEVKTPLEYKEFEEYIVPTIDDGIYPSGTHWVFHFKNHFGASVIKHYGSYGFDDDLFELAVIKKVIKHWELCYDTPITNDVIGYLTNEEVLEYLKKIKEL